MTNEKMLASVMSIVTYFDTEERERFDFVVSKREDFSALTDVPAKLAEVVKQLREDIGKEEAKKSGRASQLSAAKRILKSAIKTNKEALTYAATQSDKQCVCDGYRVVRLVNPLALPTLPDGMEYMDISKVVVKGYDMEEIELPNMAKLSAYIKTYKAEHKNNKEAPRFDLGEDWQIVNAQYLLDMMILLPNAKAYATKGKSVSMIYFEDEEGNDGALCSVRVKDGEVRQRTEV